MLIFEEYPSVSVSVLAGSVFFSTAFAFGLLAVAEGTWSNWLEATCMPSNCFCEKPRDGLLRQPANTFSNLGFTVCGILVLCETVQQKMKASKRKMTPMERLGEAFGTLFGLANILLGLGSGWFHASLTFYGQWLDNVGMFVVVSAAALYSLASARLYQVGSDSDRANRIIKQYFFEYIAVNIVLAYMVLVFPVTRRYVFGLLLLASFVLELRTRSTIGAARTDVLNIKILLGALATFVLAFAIWILDIKGIVCKPESLIQGHAAWHLLDSVASFLLFVYLAPVVFPGAAKYVVKKKEQPEETNNGCVIV